MKIIIILLTICIFITGCQSGPSNAPLTKEIQAKLDNKFQQGLFKVVKLSRNGSYPFTQNDETPRLLVYYKTRIEFLKDYNLSEWNKINLSTLSSILGAKQLGISGVKHEGNKKGDILKVWGTSTYVRKNDQWISSNIIETKTLKKSHHELSRKKSRLEKNIDDINLKITEFKKKNEKKQLGIISYEIKKAYKNIHLKLNKINNIISFTSGVKSGGYNSIGQGMEKIFSKNYKKFKSYPSSGSIENCQIVGSGLADFGLSQTDIAYMAQKGDFLFDNSIPLENLRAVCSLYPEAIQIVTLKSAGFKKLDDLRGKKINVGPIGSGTRTNALQILKADGLDKDEFSYLGNAYIFKAVEQLKNGEIDAFFSTWACPSRLIENLASSHPIFCLPVDHEISKNIRAELPYLLPVIIPKNTYNGQDRDINTLGVTAMVITHKDTKPEKVKNFLELMFGNLKILLRESPQANYISKKTAILGIPIDMHPGAKEFFNLK
ncbi:TAXI family TRAP transporter solute-binding subunit [bacterium]|nr:TAXI family TRAP transporter solute-binding subunit [bacterium]